MRPAIDAKQAKTKDAYLRRHFHITLEFFDMLRAHQDYKCAICREPENKFKNALSVDHDHKTGEVRGLLCWKCNRLLGKFRDDHELVQRTALYVTVCPVVKMTGAQTFTCPGRLGSAVRAKALAKLSGKPTPKRRKRAKRKSSARRVKRTVKI